MQRAEAIADLAGMIVDLQRPHPVRVGFDGVDAAGKTRLADEIAAALTSRGRSILRVSLDGFHQPRERRYRQGRNSPQGYYEDSFDLQAVQQWVLEPLGPGGSLNYRPASFDFRTDCVIEAPVQQAAPNAILLFDGVFLHRPELRACWDFSVFVQVDAAVSLQRAVERDLALFGRAGAVRSLYEQRYLPAQRAYLDRVRPERLATVLWDNNDPAHPWLRVNL